MVKFISLLPVSAVKFTTDSLMEVRPMQDLMKQIVNLDREARGITDAAQREKVDSEKEVAQKREQIRKEYLEEARKRIATNEPQERAVAEERWKKVAQKNEQISKNLDQLYQKNGDRWVSEIVARVTGE